MNLKINFVLKTTSVVAVINFGYKEFDPLKNKTVYKPLKYYTGITVSNAEWDPKAKLPYERSKRGQLENMTTTIHDVFNYLRLQGDVNPEILKTELDSKLKGITTHGTVTKVRLADFIIEAYVNNPDIKPQSKKGYKNIANKLYEFESHIGKLVYTNELDEELYKKFIERVKLKLNRINAVWVINKDMTSALNEIGRRYKIDVFKPSEDLAKKDRVQQVTADTVYLTFEDIQKIIQHQPKTDKLRNTKLILLTLLFTGCRHSDVHKIYPQHLYDQKGEKFFYARYLADKTDIEVIVPILKPLQDAIDENDGKVAYKIAQQNFNDYVKILCQECGLDEEMTISFTDKNGKKQFETKRKYEYVSSHIERRSLVTNLINHIPITVLSKITGHTIKDRSIIFDYNKISLIDNAVLFRKLLRRAADEDREHFFLQLV